jgi:hypothetical protein
MYIVLNSLKCDGVKLVKSAYLQERDRTTQHGVLLIPEQQLTSKSPPLEQSATPKHLGFNVVHFNDCDNAKCLSLGSFYFANSEL